MEKALFGSELDPQFPDNGWSDTTEFGTVGKATRGLPLKVSSIRGSTSHG